MFLDFEYILASISLSRFGCSPIYSTLKRVPWVAVKICSAATYSKIPQVMENSQSGIFMFFCLNRNLSKDKTPTSITCSPHATPLHLLQSLTLISLSSALPILDPAFFALSSAYFSSKYSFGCPPYSFVLDINFAILRNADHLLSGSVK